MWRRIWVGLGLAVLAGALLGGLWAQRPRLPGAGAAYQEAPEQALAGGTAKLSLRLAVWGAGGAAAGRYHDVHLHVRDGDGPGWQDWPARQVDSGPDAGLTYRFDVPVPNTPGKVLVYRYSFTFDGRSNSLDGLKPITIVTTAAPP